MGAFLFGYGGKEGGPLIDTVGEVDERVLEALRNDGEEIRHLTAIAEESGRLSVVLADVVHNTVTFSDAA